MRAPSERRRSSIRSGEVVLVTSSGDERKPFHVVYRLGSQASEDFAKQVFAVIGTLMTAVASFYFASRATTGATAKAAVSSPTIAMVGTGLQLAKAVRLVQGARDIPVAGVISNETTGKCTLTLDPTLPTGTYDVVVANSDGGEAKLAQGFTVDP
jgi:hypothetical protein